MGPPVSQPFFYSDPIRGITLIGSFVVCFTSQWEPPWHTSFLQSPFSKANKIAIATNMRHAASVEKSGRRKSPESLRPKDDRGKIMLRFLFAELRYSRAWLR